MYFQHAPEMWQDYAQLVPSVLFVGGLTAEVAVGPRVAAYTEVAATRLARTTEGELPEIQAWRRAFARMGLKPTQYRCAAEALLRRFKREGSLPQIHPLIDLCNAVSVAFAIPVAVFDVSKLTEYVEVRYATGDESYETFSGEIEHPEAHEVVFADAAGRVHARRWTNRQSGYSAMRATTTAALIVAEALHGSATADVHRLTATLADEISGAWSVTPRTAILSQAAPRFEF